MAGKTTLLLLLMMMMNLEPLEFPLETPLRVPLLLFSPPPLQYLKIDVYPDEALREGKRWGHCFSSLFLYHHHHLWGVRGGVGDVAAVVVVVVVVVVVEWVLGGGPGEIDPGEVPEGERS